ncbi:MAG: hypothetical protein AAF184_09510 [Pseudomonadota bacterium]
MTEADWPSAGDHGDVWEHGSIDGVLSRLDPPSAGTSTGIAVHLWAGERYVGAQVYVSLSVLAELRSAGVLLGETVRLYGKATWRRRASGAWDLRHLDARGFDILTDAPLGELITDLRRLYPTKPGCATT